MEGEDWRARIPPGFRFVPRDDELLLFYLMPKLTDQPLPCGVVTEAEVYKHHARELLGASHEAYFFTSRNRKYPNGTRPDRRAGGGFWKASSVNKDIKTLDNLVIGHKRTLAYHINEENLKERRTDWLMVEYAIPSFKLPLKDEKLDQWVICKVYLNNKGKNTNGSEAISENTEIGSSSHSVIYKDAKDQTEIDNLQQDNVTGKQVQVLHNCSNNVEEQACPSYANRDMSQCIEMPSYVPPQLAACTVQCNPSRLGQESLDSQSLVALSPTPPAFSNIQNNLATVMEGEDWRLRVPPGFRFTPTDNELLLFYLMPKLTGQPIPCGIVMENEVYKHHPQELLGTNHEAYFFTSRNRKYPNGKKPDRKACGGFWKASTNNKEIKAPDNLVIGHKRMLAYYIGDGTPKGRKTDWLMVEFTIPHSQLPLQDEKLDTWVICKVYLNNRGKNTNGGGAIFEDQAIGSSSHSIVNEDRKDPTGIGSLQQDMVTSKHVQMMVNCSNHREEQAYMQSSPSCANRAMPLSMEMSSYMPPQLVAYKAQSNLSRVGQSPLDSQSLMALPPPPTPAFMGCDEAGPSTSNANFMEPIITPQLDFSAPPPAFTGCAEARPSTSHTNLVEPIITPQLDFSTPPPAFIRSTKAGPSTSHPSLVEPIITLQRDFSAPQAFTGCDEAGPSTFHANLVEPIITSQLNFSASTPTFTGFAKARPSTFHESLVEPIITPQLDFSAPPLSFTGSVEVGPSTSHANSKVSTLSRPLDFSINFPGSFGSKLPDLSEILQGIDADPYIKYFYFVEAKLKEALGDSWLEEI